MLKLGKRLRTGAVVLASALTLAGCKTQSSTQATYQMGDRVIVGPLTYNVVNTEWKGELGDGVATLRTPQNRFLVITLSVTNGGGSELSMPLFSLEHGNQEYREVSSGEGIDRWMGLIRNLSPAETRIGKIVFDVPLTSYRLRLTDGGEAGTEKSAWVDIPLRMEVNQGIDVPITGRATQ